MKYLYLLQLLSCERGTIPVLASTKEFESFSAAADNAEKEANAFFEFYRNDAMDNDNPLPVFHCNDDTDDPDTNLLYWIIGYNFSNYWFITEIQIEK
uniref:Uncharacterized protein n=1 Tax=Siphoviridae sp. ct96x5 TaxID=2825367 RepID=A0A8S5PSN1_9CAUD|nr:MAG TPA: hypothetical protein [Siphoviridae sp. ct96x5]